ncbi:glycoside hydrolase family 9 protein [Occallatibacter riparius]|uniref:Glycoside hydrolase family 9 protein n=1 Tax=Occallatibacter riparius TaxID=1002689 RepID=A0A9J7BRM7_9BACT|nr:glycoside hydrolase family 9 protein [Occallatibacter riparius]UWZ83701.1 glycoside hydrolase family 9 protein [Occallatibacter riparius]
MPMQARSEDGAEFRWLHKKVLDSRVLDSMEDLSSWSFVGDGEMTLATDRARYGEHALRISSTTNVAQAGGDKEWEDLVATRKFANEDWSRFNRISLWVYPDVVGAPAISCTLVLNNDGKHKLPDSYNEGRHESIPLKNHEWNQIVWEIAPLSRDHVTAVDFAYSLPKKIPDPGDRTVLYIDQLELQTVVPDHVEGWDVAAGKIAFSHSGYTAGSQKSAIASDLAAHEFSLIDQQTGRVVFTRPVEAATTPLGKYQTLDFSHFRQPGTYAIKAGDTLTRSFRIGDDAWRSSIWKAINFMYSERCGTNIPGIHNRCHQDIYTTHGDQRIVVNGGYHDAGDLSATGHTPAMAYALLSLAESLRSQGEDSALTARLLNEARWGLNWVLKTRFGNGYRSTGQLVSYWTDGVMGTADDRFGEAVNNPEWNFRVAAVEALAARMFKGSDPDLAARSLATAEEDWKYAVDGLKTAAPLPEVYGASDELERISYGVVASIELYRATGEQRYADEAVALGDQVLASQERRLQPWSIPLTGYFYTSPKRENLFHRFHVGQEQEPIIALVRLCEALPNHDKWMKWYSAVVLHSQYYLKAASAVDEPFGVLPAAVYRDSEVRLIPESKTWTPLRAADRDAYFQEVHKGIPLGGEYYLRRFPVWFDFRGNSSVLLSQAKALSAAGRLRGDLDAEDLAQKQAQWLVGRNPFSTSLMYGEGYDWTPLYSVRSGQMVGALPVGIETRGMEDAPYWPTQICWTYKEVWTQPVGQWLWLMQDIAVPATVKGMADPSNHRPVEFREQESGQLLTATPSPMDGTFSLHLPEGHYDVRQGSAHTDLTVLPGTSNSIDLRPDRLLDFKVSFQEIPGQSEILIQVSAEGAGPHVFAIRSDNLAVQEQAAIKVDLTPGKVQQIVWHAHVLSTDTPWVAVVVPDDALANRREVTGAEARH